MRLAPLAALALSTNTALAQGGDGAVVVTLSKPASGPAEAVVTLRNDLGAPSLTLREAIGPGTQTLRVALPPLPRATHSVQAGLVENGRITAQGAVQLVEGRIGLDFETTLHPDLAVSFADYWDCDNTQRLAITRSDNALSVVMDGTTTEFQVQNGHYASSDGSILAFGDNRATLGSVDADTPDVTCAPALFRPLFPLTASAHDDSWRIDLDRGTAVISVPGVEENGLADTGLLISARRDGSVRLRSRELTLDLTNTRCRSPRTGLTYPFTATLDAQDTDVAPEGCAGDPLRLLSDTEWRITSLLGQPISLAATSELTIKLVDGQISGRGPCNRYVGTAAVDAGRLALRDFGTTRLSCAANLRNIEMRFLDAMEAATGFDLSTADMLTLTAGPIPVLTASPRPAQ